MDCIEKGQGSRPPGPPHLPNHHRRNHHRQNFQNHLLQLFLHLHLCLQFNFYNCRDQYTSCRGKNMGIYLSCICFFCNYIWQILTLHLMLFFLSSTWFEVYFCFFPNHFHWDPMVFYQKQVHPSIQPTENLIFLYVVQEHPLVVAINVVQVPKSFKKTHFYI